MARARTIVLGVMLAAFAGTATGQDQPAGAAAVDETGATTQRTPASQGERSLLSFSLEGRGELGFDADLDEDGDGSVSVTRIGASFNARYRASERVGIGLGAGAEYSFYDFDGYETVAGGGDPIDDAFLYQVTPTLSYRASEQWTLIGGAILRWAGEEDADAGDSFTGGGLGVVNYHASDSLTIGFGFIVASRLEDDTVFIPALSIDWAINDRWRLSNEGRPGLTLSYKATDRLTLLLDGAYESRDFRLSDDNPIPGGAMKDTRVPIALGARWRALENLLLTGRVGVYAYQNYEFRNAASTEVDDIDVDPSMFVTLEAQVTF